MDEQIAEVRIKFKETSGGLFEHLCPCNELVIRIQPDEAIYMKVLTKRPGIDMRPEGKDLDLTYREKYKVLYYFRILFIFFNQIESFLFIGYLFSRGVRASIDGRFSR